MSETCPRHAREPRLVLARLSPRLRKQVEAERLSLAPLAVRLLLEPTKHLAPDAARTLPLPSGPAGPVCSLLTALETARRDADHACDLEVSSRQSRGDLEVVSGRSRSTSLRRAAPLALPPRA